MVLYGNAHVTPVCRPQRAVPADLSGISDKMDMELEQSDLAKAEQCNMRAWAFLAITRMRSHLPKQKRIALPLLRAALWTGRPDQPWLADERINQCIHTSLLSQSLLPWDELA